jgi:hypothetical protein
MAANLKREKDIYHHGPTPIPIICHLCHPSYFSLVSPCKVNKCRQRLHFTPKERHIVIVNVTMPNTPVESSGFFYSCLICLSLSYPLSPWLPRPTPSLPPSLLPEQPWPAGRGPTPSYFSAFTHPLPLFLSFPSYKSWAMPD